YVDAARKKADNNFGPHALDFKEASDVAHRLDLAGARMLAHQRTPPKDPQQLNQVLRQAQRALLVGVGLPKRPSLRHGIYDPGPYTGYAAVVIPGVNEAIDKHDLERARQQIAVLARALERATTVLNSYR